MDFPSVMLQLRLLLDMQGRVVFAWEGVVSFGCCPEPQGVALLVQNFLGRLPIGFNVVILSPHGFFGQANVLGKPDTGGQVCTCPESVF